MKFWRHRRSKIYQNDVCSQLDRLRKAEIRLDPRLLLVVHRLTGHVLDLTPLTQTYCVLLAGVALEGGGGGAHP